MSCKATVTLRGQSYVSGNLEHIHDNNIPKQAANQAVAEMKDQIKASEAGVYAFLSSSN